MCSRHREVRSVSRVASLGIALARRKVVADMGRNVAPTGARCWVGFISTIRDGMTSSRDRSSAQPARTACAEEKPGCFGRDDTFQLSLDFEERIYEERDVGARCAAPVRRWVEWRGMRLGNGA
jgi:hypothetical protein